VTEAYFHHCLERVLSCALCYDLHRRKRTSHPLEVKDLETKISWNQRKLSRKKKFSKKWKRQKLSIQKIYSKKARILKDFHHKLSTEISKNHAIVVMEDLKIANMSASAKGRLEEPGSNVKAKSGLNKAILRQGWYAFRQMVDYKLQWAGGKFILVNPRNTSKSVRNVTLSIAITGRPKLNLTA